MPMIRGRASRAWRCACRCRPRARPGLDASEGDGQFDLHDAGLRMYALILAGDAAAVVGDVVVGDVVVAGAAAAGGAVVYFEVSTDGQVAQLVEHVTENHGVGGSIPSLATSLRSPRVSRCAGASARRARRSQPTKATQRAGEGCREGVARRSGAAREPSRSYSPVYQNAICPIGNRCGHNSGWSRGTSLPPLTACDQPTHRHV